MSVATASCRAAAIAGAAVLALLEAGAAVPAAGQDADPCRRSGEDVVARSGDLVVIDGRTATYGCLRSRGERVELTNPADDEVRGDLLRLAGTWVLLDVTGEEFDDTYEVLQAIDVAAGPEGRVDVLQTAPRDAARGYFKDAVLKPNGSSAWIGGDPRSGFTYRVEKCEAERCLGRDDAEPRILDRGRRIASRSLFRKGSRIYWREGRARRCATLR